MRHVVEVDQSIKIEQAGPSVLAFSNGIQHAIVVPSNVKEVGLRLLQAKGKPKNAAVVTLFTACLFLLLEDHLLVLDRICIDTEYTGQESLIQSLLLVHIRRQVPISIGVYYVQTNRNNVLPPTPRPTLSENARIRATAK